MRKTTIYTSFASAAVILVLLLACNKDKPYKKITPGTLVHFNGGKFQNYNLNTNPAPVYAVGVGTTDVAASDRTVTFKITSPTGAVAGTHYTVSGNTVTIPANQTIANINIQGVYSQYTAGRKDTLVITLTQPSIDVAKFQDTVILVIKGPCYDGTITQAILTGMNGNYAHSNDNGFGAYGPYTTSITSTTVLTASTARSIINNVWDDGFGSINFIMDWTDPNNTTIKVEAPTITPADAGILNAAYAGMKLIIRDHPTPGTASNKFSVCNSVLNLRYQLGVYNPATSTVLGYFANVGTTIMQR